MFKDVEQPLEREREAYEQAPQRIRFMREFPDATFRTFPEYEDTLPRIVHLGARLGVGESDIGLNTTE